VTTVTNGDRVEAYFIGMGRQPPIVCISRFMNDYAYQIKGALENAQGQFLGLRVLVCDKNNFEIVDAPVEILDKETSRYLEFRLKVTDVIDIQRLPYAIQNKIRIPLGRWLDRWVLNNFYGDTSNRKGVNPWFLEER